MVDLGMYGTEIPADDAVLHEWEQTLANDARHDFRATPDERRELAARAAQLRAAERQRAEHAEPTVAGLATKFGWSPAVVAHLVQPYCYCEIGHDGWQWCRHAEDEGVAGSLLSLIAP